MKRLSLMLVAAAVMMVVVSSESAKAQFEFELCDNFGRVWGLDVTRGHHKWDLTGVRDVFDDLGCGPAPVCGALSPAFGHDDDDDEPTDHDRDRHGFVFTACSFGVPDDPTCVSVWWCYLFHGGVGTGTFCNEVGDTGATMLIHGTDCPGDGSPDPAKTE